MTFTACPTKCTKAFPGIAPFDIAPISTQVTITATGTLHFPPQTQPVLPDFSFTCGNPAHAPCVPSYFSQSDLSYKCDGGGGVINPQWVTVKAGEQTALDYVLAEGQVGQSRVSRKDAPWNHYSEDELIAIDLDEPYRYLVSSAPEDDAAPYRIGSEWEINSFPEQFRPTIGDRVSVFGYWVHDCGHSPFYTEVHPPVGVATDRLRPVLIPESAGLGQNVYAPGVVSDVFFNRQGGEITDNCSDTGLHLPGAGQDYFHLSNYCVPDPHGLNPINRAFEYNIYLPPNPHDILQQAGFQNPPQVGLYYEWQFPPGIQPKIDVIPTGQGNFTAKGTYLHVTIDLTNFTGDIYSGRIIAAWKYPSPDNWGLREYQVRLNSLNVIDDGDFVGSGEWNLWMNVPNTDQEWTKVISGDVDDGTYTFAGKHFETQSTVAGRNLGPDVKLFPEQMMRLVLAGYEDDGIETSDDAGFVGHVSPQSDDTVNINDRNLCFDSSPEFRAAGFTVVGSTCTVYDANMQIIPMGPVTPVLTSAGQTLYDSTVVHPGDLGGCNLTLALRCFDTTPPLTLEDWHPNALHPPGPEFLGEAPGFEDQELEEFSFTEISPEGLKHELAALPEDALDRVLTEWRGKIDVSFFDDHPAWEMLILEAALPPGKFDQHFGDIPFIRPVFGDTDCSKTVDGADVLLDLRLFAQTVNGAGCYNVSDVNCDGVLDARDALANLRFFAHLSGLSKPSDCLDIGAPIHLTIDLSTPTATPQPSVSHTSTVTPTPSATATSTVTPTPIVTATPIPTPTPTPTPSSTTPTPSPTPDNSGPTYSNVTDIDPIYDTTGNAACTPLVTTISASISDPSGIQSPVRLYYRYVDQVNAPTAFAQAAVFYNINTHIYSANIDPPDFPEPPPGPPGRIEWYWQANDNSPLHNTSVYPVFGYGDTTVYDCASVIP